MPSPDLTSDAFAEADRRIQWCLRKGRDHLNLIGLGLDRLPPDFDKLTGLRYLDLTGNRLSTFPAAICSFTDLRWLGLNGNAIDELPGEIGRLQNLERLYLRDNRLQRLPVNFGSLTRLVELDLHNNRIANLPRSFLELLERSPDQEPLYFDLDDNPGQVAVVARQGIEALASYLREIREEPAPLRAQGKLLLVGEGGVGKSTLLHALQNGDFVEGRRATHGLKRGQVCLGSGEQAVRLNCWDFSGQEEVRETHQIFFTAPAIYLLVWNARLGEHMARLKDWLWLIKHRTEGKARVLIVCTQASIHAELESRQSIIDEFGVGKEPFGDLKQRPLLIAPGFLRVECDERNPRGKMGIEHLKETLLMEVSEDDAFRQAVPESWDKIQQDLEQGRIADPFLGWTEFERLCQDHGIKDAALFARTQHRLGRLVWIERDGLREIVILNPDWFSRAIGFVLHDPKGRVDSADGEGGRHAGLAPGFLGEDRMRDIWLDPKVTDELGNPAPPCPEGAIPTFHRLMEVFDLSHPVRGPRGRRQRLIPNRLSATQPPTWDAGWRGEDVRLRRRLDLLGYDGRSLNDWLASAFLYRLMVRLHTDALGRDDSTRAAHWRRGFRIQRPYELPYAEARISRDSNSLFVEVRGSQPFAAWERIEFAIQDLAREIGGDFDYEVKVRSFAACGISCSRDTPQRQYFDEGEVRLWATSPNPDERFERIPCRHPDGRCKLVLNVHELWTGVRAPENDPLGSIPRIPSEEQLVPYLRRMEHSQRLHAELLAAVRSDLAQVRKTTEGTQELMRNIWEAQIHFADRFADQSRRLDEAIRQGPVTDALREELTAFRDSITSEVNRAVDRLDHPSRNGPRLFYLQESGTGVFRHKLRLRLLCERQLKPVTWMNGTTGLGEFEIAVDREWWIAARPYVRGTARLLNWILPIGRILAGEMVPFRMEAATDLVELLDKHLGAPSVQLDPDSKTRSQDVLERLHAELRRQTGCDDLSQASHKLGLVRVNDKVRQGKYLWVHPDEARNFTTGS